MRARSTCNHDHTHLIEFAHAFGYYSRAATISFAELQVRLLFKGGYYSRCGFYSNIYGIIVITIVELGMGKYHELIAEYCSECEAPVTIPKAMNE